MGTKNNDKFANTNTIIGNRFKYAFEDELGGGTKRAFEDELGGGTKRAFEKDGDIESKIVNPAGAAMKTNQWGGGFQYAFGDELGGGTQRAFEKGGDIESKIINPAGNDLQYAFENKLGGGLKSVVDSDFIQSGAGYTAFRASEQPRYIPPYMKRKLASNQKAQMGVAKIMAGTGPISMVVVYLLDFAIDFIIQVWSTLNEIRMDGFEIIYDMVLGEYQGVFPSNNRFGTFYSFRFLRTFLTVITPPLGVFMAKGIKGWFNILMCVMFCYIHYVLGILYAFVITFKNRYADRYEQVQANIVQKIKNEQELDGQGTIEDWAIIMGTIIFFGSIILVIGWILSSI
jgi:uncharacterized membrane protein YqaE (UPF0057 family)